MHSWYVLIALCCSVLGAGVTLASKLLVGTVTSFSFAFLRYFLATVSLAPFMIKERTFHAQKSDLPLLIFLGFSQVLLFNVFYFLALSYSSAVSVSIIGAMNPMMTLLACALFLGQKISHAQQGAIVLSFIGSLFVVTEGKFDSLLTCWDLGALFMLLAVCFQVAYSLALHKLSAAYSPTFLTLATMVSGIVFVIPFIANRTFLHCVTDLTTLQWSLLVFIGAVGTALAFYLFTIAIKHLGASYTSLITFSTVPVFVMVFSFFILQTPLSLWQLLGAALVVGSLFIALL